MLRLRMGTALTSLTVAGLLQGCISPLNQLESDVQVERSIRAHWRVPDRSPQNIRCISSGPNGPDLPFLSLAHPQASHAVRLADLASPNLVEIPRATRVSTS